MSTAGAAGLGLRRGDWVRVRSEAEILATLDDQGRHDALVFMPEMLAFCGRRLRVAAIAHKTCDTISGSGGRRMRDAVHLEDVRCDGAAHGGCQAACLMFWKEAWLEKVAAGPDAPLPGGAADETPAVLTAATRGAEDSPEEAVWACQITELLRSTSPLPWWDVRQYLRDLLSGNVGLVELLRAFHFRLTTNIMARRGYRLALGLYDKVQSWTGGKPYPIIQGRCRGKTPRETLDLQAGEWVEIKGLDEIAETLDERRRNRGMAFDKEMALYCGERRRVLQRVDRIIDERTGRMLEFKNDCIMLEGVVCRSALSEKRIGCPRAIYSYWREGWLRKVDGPAP